jgi:hypothetical protein
MNMITIRIFDSLGLLGAVLMFVGDICVHGFFGSGGDFMDRLHLVIPKQSDVRFMAGGFIAPIASFLYCLGFLSIYKMISPKSPVLAIISLVVVVIMMLFGGVYHAMWGIRSLSIKAGLPSSNYQELYNKILKYMHLFYNTMLTLGGISALLLLFAVLSGRSLYPKWTVFVNPGFLLLFKPLTRFIPSPIGSLIFGGYLNIVFIVFFSVILIFI